MLFNKLLTTIIIILFYIGAYTQTGIVKGRVFNKINNEPIPFASIAITGSTYGTSGDIDGNYELTGIKPGLYNITATVIGFESKTLYEISVTANKPVVLDFDLTENVTKLNEVVVTNSLFVKKEESPISLRNIGENEITRTPGANRDISKVIQSLPGVAPTVSFRNDIIIRGGSPNENRFYIDDIETPNINHFATQGASGGPVGMINVDFIREVLFYSSAFPANRNNSLSSVMDFKLKDGRNDRLGGKFTLGASETGISLEGPANKNATFLVSARRSYLQFLFKTIGLPFLPTYNDFQVKYKWKISQREELSFIGLGAIDDMVLNTDLQKTGDEAQRYLLGYLPVLKQWNYTNGFRYINYGKKGYTMAVLSRNFLNNESFKYFNNIETAANKTLDYKSQEIENKFRIEHTTVVNNYKITYGTNYDYSKYNNSTFNRLTTPAGIDTINYYTAFDIWKWGLYGQISRSFIENRLGFSFGLRSDGNNYARSMINSAKQLSPRLSLSYSLTPQLSFNANTGLYYQLPPYTVLGFRDSRGELINKENNLKYIRAHHFVAGFDYFTKNNLKINIEGFLKYFDQYPFVVREQISLANLGSDFGVIGNTEVKSIAIGRSYGIEFFAQQKLYKGFYGLFTYTFVRSEFENSEGKFIPSAWDIKHIVNLTAGKTFRKNWELGLRWRFALGQPYTPYNFEESRKIINWDINKQGIINWSELNIKRLPAFHNLDIRIDRKYFYKNISIEFYVDIQNLYNFKTGLQPLIIVESDNIGNPIIDPADNSKYKAKYVENTTGTILPSIGVVIEF
ncbi:MAG: TonB-dependent receptor [Bacteroidales bacterium]|nr:TonB-dependent receptor [Bacteroidales bacterium]